MSVAMNREFAQILDEEIGRLPTKLRSIVVLLHLEGLSLQESAKRLGITPSTAHGRLAKSRAILKSRLLNRGVTITLAGLTAGMVAATRETAAMVAESSALLTHEATAFATGSLAPSSGVSSAVLKAAEKEVAKVFLANTLYTLSFVAVLLLSTVLIGSLGYGAVDALTATPKRITIVAPPGLESTDGNSSVPNDARTVLRTQELWSASFFSDLPEGGAWLVGLSPRLDGAAKTEPRLPRTCS